jgi:DNA gyrase subunit A
MMGRMRRRRETSPEDVVAELRARLHIYGAIDLALRRWPEVAHVSFEAESTDSLVEDLKDLLAIDDVQASAICDVQVRRTGRLERARIAQEVATLRTDLAEAESRLARE